MTKNFASILVAPLFFLAATGSIFAGNSGSEPAPTLAPLSCPPTEPSKAKDVSNQADAKSLTPVVVQPISQSDRVKFFVPAADALARFPKALIVDARSDAEARQTWIPSSAHIPISFLSSSTLLGNASEIVVVTNVIDDLQVLKTLQGMLPSKASHFHILEGGIRAWAQAGGALAGNHLALFSPTWVNASQFHELIRQGAKAVVIGKATHNQLQVIPGLVELRDETTTKGASTELPTLQSFRPIVLVAQDVNSAALPRGLQKELSRQPVYAFLDSGDNYFTFLRRQKEISSNAGNIVRPRCDLR